MSDNTCSSCALFRGTDGYCRKKGTWVNALSTESCWLGRSEEPAPLPKKKEGPAALTKTCKDCGRTFPLDEFPLHPKSRDGHAPMCRECYSKKMKAVQKVKAQKAVKEAMPEGMRRCTKCLRILPVSEFGACKKTKDGLHYECKDCRNAYGRSLYHSRHGGVEVPARHRNPDVAYSKNLANDITDAQMVARLREHGWTVTCTRTTTEDL